MHSQGNIDFDTLQEQLQRLRGRLEVSPSASVVIPVNAQGDLKNVLNIISDLTRYKGAYALEIILVINNYPADAPPAEIQLYKNLGLRVISIPNVRRPGEAVGFTARIPGVEAAASEKVILFDADCRIPSPSALIDWYVHQFESGAKAAYSRVDFYDLQQLWSVRAQIFIHHLMRWVKRVVLHIPTTRGSNYAVNRSMMLQLYGKGMLADEMNVGPTFVSSGGRVVYSGAKELAVLTSGRMFIGGWRKLFRYLKYRLRYNIRVLPVRVGVARHTKRENDPVRRYSDNKFLE